jgi:ATP-binding cassette subfamily F protein uup
MELLNKASFQIKKGDRICLVGRNGAGKSTLLKLVDGEILPDNGLVWRKPGLVISRLEQELPEANTLTVMEYVASGLSEVGALLARFEYLSHQLDDKSMREMERVQHELEARDGWAYQQNIDQVLTRLNLPCEQLMSNLSGGWRRRVALARALVCSPDLLLLDEPTNHLDIETISWLEQQLLDFPGAVLFITHDRELVRRLATKILQLDRGTLRTFNHGYDAYLEERAHLLEVEDQQNALFDKRLADEETWIRQGIKARRTRNEGRVRALQKLRKERGARKEQLGTAKIAITSGLASGKIVAELDNVSCSFDDNTLFEHVSLTVLRGDKIGLLGRNGVGKTSLLRIILGELAPSSGDVKLGTRMKVAYFDQMRSMLDPEKTIVDIVGQGRERIEINGKDRHVLSYLSDFLFSPARSRTPIKALSGGECNRIQLACLFSQPANVLVLDEPTNDLDIETLELLENVLVEFPGTVLLVSHDRDFMDNVVSSTIAFEGGVVKEYIGGFKDWQRQGGSFDGQARSVATASDTASKKSTAKKAKKLSYKLQQELDKLPGIIEKLEAKIETMQQETAEADFYQQGQELVTEKLEALASAENELVGHYERWEELP